MAENPAYVPSQNSPETALLAAAQNFADAVMMCGKLEPDVSGVKVGLVYKQPEQDRPAGTQPWLLSMQLQLTPEAVQAQKDGEILKTSNLASALVENGFTHNDVWPMMDAGYVSYANWYVQVPEHAGGPEALTDRLNQATTQLRDETAKEGSEKTHASAHPSRAATGGYREMIQQQKAAAGKEHGLS